MEHGETRPTGILRRGAGRELCGAGALVLLTSTAIAWRCGFAAGYVATSTLLYALGAWLVWQGLPEALSRSPFGAANRVTLTRLAMSVLLAALIGAPRELADTLLWGLVALAGLTALLDAVDGVLARRSGTRFDMETDAWLTLVLCALVLHLDKAGTWVLAAGLMRYAFVAAARLWPWLDGPLAPSWRRKTVCAVQITSLIICLAPVVPRSGCVLRRRCEFAGARPAANPGAFDMKVLSGTPFSSRRSAATHIATAALALLCLWNAPAHAQARGYDIDPEHFSLGFLVDHIGYDKVLGMFRAQRGSFSFDEASGTLTDIRIEVDTSSVFTNHRKRDDHLKSPDFLNVAEFPRMLFTSSGAKRTGDRSFEISGQLEVIGKSQPLTLTATLNKSEVSPLGGAYTVGVSARGSFKRSAYGMNYAVANGWVGDEVALIIEFEAKRK